MTEGPILGIVLAAGMSRRLGRPKQLLELNRATLVEHVVRLANDSDLDATVVVGGHVANAIEAALANLPHSWLLNPDYQSGQASSLIAGVRLAIELRADAVVILLSDQPGVPLAAINALVMLRREHGAGIVMTTYGTERSHPVLFGCEHFDELLTVSGDQGGREVIKRHTSEVTLVASGLDTVPRDVDTDEDYRVLLSEAQ